MKTKLFFTLILLTILFYSCNYSVSSYRIPGFKDQYLFDNIKVEKGNSVTHLQRGTTSIFDEFDIDSFLFDNKTLSFIIVRNDSVLYERYFYDTLIHPNTPIFSISKSFVSSLLGIAIDEGYIKDLKEPITNYIPELDKLNEITLEMLLNMCSGMDSGGVLKSADIYFSTNLKETIMDYNIKKEITTEYSYDNINTLLLCMAIEKATDTNIADYLENEVWKKAGMSHDATWSVDSKENNNVKGFCGINAAPIDLVRFGSIYLHNGFYNGKQIVPEDWVKESFTKYNKPKDENGYYYSYSWRITDKNAYVAIGLMGQYVYIEPDKNIVVVRTGESYDNFDWIEFIEEMTSYL